MRNYVYLPKPARIFDRRIVIFRVKSKRRFRIGDRYGVDEGTARKSHVICRLGHLAR